jgi:hypothetical protein
VNQASARKLTAVQLDLLQTQKIRKEAASCSNVHTTHSFNPLKPGVKDDF